MCLNLIKIRNNSRHYQRGYLPLYNEVPCGHCPECVSQLQRDYFLRIYYEILYTEKLGGQTFFLTFTYNDDNIPCIDWSDKDIECCNTWLRGAICSDDECLTKAVSEFNHTFGDVFKFLPDNLPTFNRKHISMFLKSFRQLLHQTGIYTYEKQKVSPIKYYIVSEYGEEFHRPHYHCLFFIPFSISSGDFIKLCSRCWSYQIDIDSFPFKSLLPKLEKGQYINLDFSGKKWFNYHYYRLTNGKYLLKCQRGNLSYSQKNSPIIKACKGVNYISKYIHKLDSYTSSPIFEQVRLYLKCFLSPSALREFALPDVADSIQKLKNMLPFIHISQNVGVSIINVLENEFGNSLAQHLHERILKVNGDTQLYKVPNYIINRIIYRNDLNDNSLRVLTDVGVKSLYYKYLDKIEMLSQSYRDTVALAFHLDKPILDKVFSKYVGIDRVTWFNFLKGNLFGDVAKNLAIYSLTYRNVCCDDFTKFTDITPLVDTSFDAFSQRFALPVDVELNPKCMYLRAFQTECHNSFNFSPCFDRFEIWLTVWSELNRIIRQKKIQDDFRKHQDELHYRKLFNEHIHEL